MVYALGESLLDVIISSLEQVVARPGGAMLNASVSLQRAGVSATLITELGKDQTAVLMIDFLKNNDVLTEYITQYEHNKTAVALAFLDEQKKPSYTFLKDYPGQRRLAAPPVFQPGDVFLLGSLYALDPDIQPYLSQYLDAARKGGAVILYDPNIRQSERLKNNGRREMVYENIRRADIVKGSDEDFEALFGKQDITSVFGTLHEINPEALFVMTQGSEGATAFCNGKLIHAAAQPVEVVSTIGAGDGFNAGMAAFLSKHFRTPSDWDWAFVEQQMRTGIQFAASVCSSDENYIQKGMNNEE